MTSWATQRVDRTTPQLATPTYDQTVNTRRVAALLPALERSMKTSALSIAIFSSLLIAKAPGGLSIWLAVRLITTLGCMVALRHIMRRPAAAQDDLRYLASVMAVSGLVWGLLPLLIHPDSPEWRAVVVLWIFGNQSVITTVCAPSKMVFTWAMGTVCGVSALSMVLHGGDYNLVLAALIVLGGAYSFSLFGGMNKVTMAAIEGHLRASDLARSLSEANDTLETLANHDGLTGLPNRRAFIARVANEQQQLAASGWLGIVDIDHFKSINDAEGHAAGDQVLTLASRRWRARLPKDVFLARTGGDEFVIFFTRRTNDEAAEIGHLLISALAQPIAIANGLIAEASCSVGLAQVESGTNFSTALRRADEALYDAKEAGRAVVRFAADELDATAIPGDFWAQVIGG